MFGRCSFEPVAGLINVTQCEIDLGNVMWRNIFAHGSVTEFHYEVLGFADATSARKLCVLPTRSVVIAALPQGPSLRSLHGPLRRYADYTSGGSFSGGRPGAQVGGLTVVTSGGRADVSATERPY